MQPNRRSFPAALPPILPASVSESSSAEQSDHPLPQQTADAPPTTTERDNCRCFAGDSSVRYAIRDRSHSVRSSARVPAAVKRHLPTRVTESSELFATPSSPIPCSLVLPLDSPQIPVIRNLRHPRSSLNGTRSHRRKALIPPARIAFIKGHGSCSRRESAPAGLAEARALQRGWRRFCRRSGEEL